MVHFVLNGISEGFRVGFTYRDSVLVPAKQNLQGAITHPAVVEDYLQTELSLGRLVGPFCPHVVPNVHISRFGVIPKNHQETKWRLIVDLSFPSGQSVNDGIPKELCSLKYITIDDAINYIVRLGPGTHLAKIDIKSAFRLLPVHAADRHLLGVQWKGAVFIDTCLPFGLRSAPKLFNTLADLLAWIMEQHGAQPLLHYLDDFLTIGPPNSNICQQNLDTIKQICDILGVPLALEKVEGPATSLSFLGITLDTVTMEARLPPEKLRRLQLLVTEWLDKSKATKRDILSLVGHLQHATKVIRQGRTFVSRLYMTAAKVKKLNFYTRLNREFCSDLCWWNTFLHHWNGLSLLRWSGGSQSPDVIIQTDASGLWGCGAFHQGRWFQWEWTHEWTSVGIMAKELTPIILSCVAWGKALQRQRVLFQCDNSGVVASIHKGSCKDLQVMHLLCTLTFFTAYYDIEIMAEHIPGVTNTTADHLSRNNMLLFFGLNPQAHPLPTPLPPPLLAMLTPPWEDWTSANFRSQFSNILSMV